MEKEIKEYFEKILINKLPLKNPIKITKIKKLGAGASNLNFLVQANNHKFIFRMGIDQAFPKRITREFKALKAIEKTRISPKAYLSDETKKHFTFPFSIIEYLEGISIDKEKSWHNPIIMAKLGSLTAKLHIIPVSKIKGISKGNSRYSSYFKEMQEYKKRLKKYTKNKEFFKMFNDTYASLKNKNYLEPLRPSTLVHGDIQEQNIVNSKGELKLIDFESLKIADPAIDVMLAFNEFGRPFTKEEQEIFYKSYFKIRKDPTLRSRVQAYLPLRIFIAVLWAIEQAFKIKNKKFHKAYLENASLKDAADYANVCVQRAIEAKVIDKRFSSLRVEDLI